MSNHELLAGFERWLLATDSADGTIDQRLRHVRAIASRHDLATMTDTELEEELAAIRHQADETRKSKLASWRVFFGWAHRKGMRSDDPTIDLPAVRVRRRMPRLAEDDAIEDALAGASSRDRALLLLARDVWLRLSELTSLHTDHRHGDRLYIRGKGGKERIAYLSKDAAGALDALEREQGRGYYFPGLAGDHLHPQSVHKIIKRLTGYHPHALRHRGATEGFRATRNLRAVQEQLGHASLATTQIYTHLSDEERQSTVDAGGLRRAA